MNWTKEFPKEDGIYFAKIDDNLDASIRVASIYKHWGVRRIMVLGGGSSITTTEFIDSGLRPEWLGPITPEMFLIRELPIGAALLARPSMEDDGDDSIDATKTFIATADGIDDCISTNPFKAVEMLLQEIKKHDKL